MKKKHILESYIKKLPFNKEADSENETTLTINDDTVTDDGVIRKEKFYSYFIYATDKNKMIGSIYLTEKQACKLNSLMCDISFIRS